MQSIIYSNVRGSVTIAQTAPYFLQEINGISALNVDIISQKAPYQNGSTYINSYLGERNIDVTILINAENETALTATKKTLTHLFTYGIESTLTYSDGVNSYNIAVVPTQGIEFSQSVKYPNYQTCFVRLVAHSPYLYDTTETISELTITSGGVEFDLELSDTNEFETEGNATVNLVNLGDISTHIQVTFEGPVTLAKITNVSTGEYIEIAKSLKAGEKLIINTEHGKKSVLFDNGVTQVNAFQYINLNSTFFELVPGTNVIKYSTGFVLNNPKVTTKFKNIYLGV